MIEVGLPVLTLATFQQPIHAGAFQDGQNEAEQDFLRAFVQVAFLSKPGVQI